VRPRSGPRDGNESHDSCGPREVNEPREINEPREVNEPRDSHGAQDGNASRRTQPIAPAGDGAMSGTLFDRLRDIVGPDGVVADPAQVEEQTRTSVPYRQIPDCVVYPRTAEEVAAVVRLANEARVPLWPVSTGKNWGYGEKSATYPGGITLVLARMNRIEHVDAGLAYAVIEPGVTYRDLNAHLKRERLPLWSDCAGTTESASVIGNALDKGRGLTPYADHFGNLCGMEVVLPDGQLLRTGNLTATPNRVWNVYKWGVGPYLDGLFAQSNLGIVVKAGIWLMPAPAAFDFLAFEYTAGADRFGAMIDDLRGLVFRGMLRSRPHLANAFAMLCIVSQYPEAWRGERRCLDDAALARWARMHGVSAWTFGCGLYGSRAEVRAQRQALRRTLGRYGRLWSFGAALAPGRRGRAAMRLARIGARVTGKSTAFLDQIGPAADLFRGIPTDEFARQVYVKSGRAKPTGAIDPPRDRCGFIWLGPLVPFASRDVEHMLALARPIYARHEFDFFVEVIIESPRALIVLFGIFYEREDAQDAARARAWYEELRSAAVAAGYPPYRELSMTGSHVFDGNPVAQSTLSAIKRALDPAGVIAPGRYGIR
jgi:4-cresol dehydrogenase (hydroxylating)